MIVFRLSGEHPDLPLEEIRALYEADVGEFKEVSRDGQLLLVKKDLSPKTLSRLAFTHEFYLVEKVADIKNLDRVLLGLPLKKGDTFCIRCLGFPSNADEERRAGELVYERGYTVSLCKPDVAIYLLKVENNVAISYEKHKIGGFNERNPNDRPFFHPLALDPKLARLLLNLARLKRGDRVLDPFCGSGSVLIEAGLMGLEAFGTDMDREMLWGCRKNLGFYKVKAKVDSGDATEIPLKNLDAIVTDPPYARASKMFSKGLEDLYTKFLESAFRALKPGGFLVLAVPHDARLAYASAGQRSARRSGEDGTQRVGFESLGDYLIYVHKSLTRRVYILKKPN